MTAGPECGSGRSMRPNSAMTTTPATTTTGGSTWTACGSTVKPVRASHFGLRSARRIRADQCVARATPKADRLGDLERELVARIQPTRAQAGEPRVQSLPIAVRTGDVPRARTLPVESGPGTASAGPARDLLDEGVEDGKGSAICGGRRRW